MVYDPQPNQEKELIHAILTADLTPEQLSTIHESFGLGANLGSPHPREQLFITDKRSWASLSHLEIWHKTVTNNEDWDPIIIIDADTPRDGGVWYIDRIATQWNVDHGQAESLNTLFKIRMEIGNILLCHVNYQIANIDIRESMDSVDIPYPTPDDFTQDKVYSTGFDYNRHRYTVPAWVTAEPDEMEENRDDEVLKSFVPRPEVVYRLKEEVARANGLMIIWTTGTDRKDGKFPAGSKILQLRYDPETAVPRYEKPEGSL